MLFGVEFNNEENQFQNSSSNEYHFALSTIFFLQKLAQKIFLAWKTGIDVGMISFSIISGGKVEKRVSLLPRDGREKTLGIETIYE